MPKSQFKTSLNNNGGKNGKKKIPSHRSQNNSSVISTRRKSYSSLIRLTSWSRSYPDTLAYALFFTELEWLKMTFAAATSVPKPSNPYLFDCPIFQTHRTPFKNHCTRWLRTWPPQLNQITSHLDTLNAMKKFLTTSKRLNFDFVVV